MTPESVLDRGIEELGLVLAAEGRRRLLAYLLLLQKWNRTYNLTGIDDPAKIVSHHILDSLSVLGHIPEGSMADIGSGAGLPGIPIAIVEPERAVTLNDTNGKRLAFLRQAAIELGLRNVRIHPGRAQDWSPTALFAVAISRAFSGLATFVTACRHLVARDGVLAAMKGAVTDVEYSGVPAGIHCGRAVRLHVPFVSAERHLVLCHIEV